MVRRQRNLYLLILSLSLSLQSPNVTFDLREEYADLSGALQVGIAGAEEKRILCDNIVNVRLLYVALLEQGGKGADTAI